MVFGDFVIPMSRREVGDQGGGPLIALSILSSVSIVISVCQARVPMFAMVLDLPGVLSYEQLF
jgi:hypothetical protein